MAEKVTRDRSHPRQNLVEVSYKRVVAFADHLCLLQLDLFCLTWLTLNFLVFADPRSGVLKLSTRFTVRQSALYFEWLNSN